MRKKGLLSISYAITAKFALLSGIALLATSIILTASGCQRLGEKINFPFLSNRGDRNSSQTTVFGQIKEDAVSSKPVGGAKVTVGEKTVTADSQGNYRVTTVSPGVQEIAVKATNHEKYEKRVEIIKGENRADIQLSLTPDETLRRILETQKQKNFEKLYDYLHPESKKVVSKKDFINFFKDIYKKNSVEIKDFKVGNSKILKSWTNPVNKRVYIDAAEIEATIIIQAILPQQEKTTTQSIKSNVHLVKVDGQWKNFWSQPQN